MSTKRRVAYRRGKRQNLFGMLLALSVVAMLVTVVYISSRSLEQKRDAYAAREAQLRAQIEAEEKRAEEIDEYEKYTKTKKYVEEVAKNRLGLVYPGEIVFVPKDR